MIRRIESLALLTFVFRLRRGPLHNGRQLLFAL